MYNKKAIGYVIVENKYYDNKYYFDYSIDNICKFILQNVSETQNIRIIITDTWDNMIIEADKYYIYNIRKDLKEEILNTLELYLENGIKDRLNFEQTEPYVMQEIKWE